MLQEIAWNTFKNTGDINTFLEFVQIKNLENNLTEANKNEYNKNKGNNNFGK